MNTLRDVGDDRADGLSGSLQANPAHRILLVDPDPYICHFGTEVLIRHGYEVSTAEDGATAWETLQANNYSLLITEYGLPRLTGVDLVRKLRAARMAVPAILVSGMMPTEELNRHPWLQIEATLLKPYTIPELLGTVKEVLRATDGAREQIAPPPNWQSQPPANVLKLW